MAVYRYKPRGVCSGMFEIELEDGIITDICVWGGCNGNLQGIARLVRGLQAGDVIERLQGIRCEGKETSCPDQLAKALSEILKEDGCA